MGGGGRGDSLWNKERGNGRGKGPEKEQVKGFDDDEVA